MKILYVEDEKFLAEAVIHVLKNHKILVDWAADGEEGLSLALKFTYDVIVLDIMLPKMSGLDILKGIRARNIKTPVIMLSALGEVEDKVNGLNLGADDYLAKPFKTAELIARLNALVRRPSLNDVEMVTFEDLKLDKTNRTLNDLPLTDKEYGVIETSLRIQVLLLKRSNCSLVSGVQTRNLKKTMWRSILVIFVKNLKSSIFIRPTE